jgi:hypothetical protein
MRGRYLLCHLITAERENASHQEIMMAAVFLSKWEESEQLVMFRPVGAKVLKTCRVK